VLKNSAASPASGLAAAAACVTATMFACALAATAQVSLGSSIDLALRNSEQVKIAESEQTRASAALSETKDAYLPSLSFTSGLAKGTGFALGDPSIVKLAAQGLLLNASQPQYVRAARAALHASEFAVENARQEVILDAALTYAELDSASREAAVLKQQESAGGDLLRVVQDRADAGLESRLATRKAQLRAAQARLKRLDLEARADYLRQHLADLTGLTASTLQTDTNSLPRFPALLPELDARAAALNFNPAIKSADLEAKSKTYFAKGQHNVNFRPEIDLLLQYGYIDDFNDYSKYYRTALPPNNAVAGVAITVPLFNQAQVAKAREADASAAKAVHEASLQRSQVDEHLVQLRRAVEQTDAASDIARLQQQIAGDNLEALQLRAQQGGEVNGASVNPADVAGAMIEERGLLADAIAAEFEHTRAELQWMHAVGTLTAWAQTAFSGR
jgi:outer membrane protein TolC